MPRHGHAALLSRLALCLIVMCLGLAPGRGASAQVQQGATLTILRGQVAIVRPNGTAIQPAPSGSTVEVGDEIRTISRSGALITFFSGTEIEMGEDTILVVEQLSRQGDKIDVSLRQVLGATLNRVQTLTGTGSTYQIQAGGAVALVRGTTFALIGPVTTPSGDVVATVCLDDCTAASTFAGCPMAPFSGLGVTTSKGLVESDCVSFSVDRTEGYFNAAAQAVTTVQQAVQGTTQGVPPGQVAAGQRQEINTQISQHHQQQDEDDPPVDPPQTPTGPPPPPGARPCNVTTTSGGFGVTTTVHDLGRPNGTFTFRYEAFGIPDRFEVIYEGHTILDTGVVSGSAVHSLTYNGSATVVTVIVTGSTLGTAWNYTVGCPT